MIAEYKAEFIEFMVRCDVLTFGDFTTKSGRKTPYFVNSGRYSTGEQMQQLARFYAAAIVDHLGDDFDVLFGPAYKGIPLAVATSMVLATEHHRDKAFCFNRKEVKDHGEGGSLVGHSVSDGDRVLIIEDVTTAGTSIRETVPLLQAAAGVKLAGLVVAVDRQERGKGELSALAEVAQTYQMPTFAIVSAREIMSHLRGKQIAGKLALSEESHSRMEHYLAEYGAKS